MSKLVAALVVCTRLKPGCREMEEKHALNLPEYPGFDQIVELPWPASTKKKL